MMQLGMKIFCCSRWLGRLCSYLLKSISWVQFSPSAHTRTDFFLHKNWLAESARAWVSNIRWKSTSIGNAELYARQKWRHVPGGRRDDTCDHGLSRRSLRVKPPTSWTGKEKVMIEKANIMLRLILKCWRRLQRTWQQCRRILKWLYVKS